MLKQVSISGLGPHLDYTVELDPRGVNTIMGPSESGKSFTLEAIVFALWGKSSKGKFQPEAIHDDADKAEVELVLDSGLIIRRSITKGKSTKRQIEIAGEVQSFSSEAKFSEALGELADDEEAVRVVIAPMAWQPLVATNARKFRDLLMRLLPEGDVAGEVVRLVAEAGYECSPEEAATPDKAVLSDRGKARKARDQASGRVQAAETRIRELKESLSAQAETGGTAVTPDMVANVDAWQSYDAAMGDAEERRAAEAAQRAWDEQRKELGDRPPEGRDPQEVLAEAKAHKKVLHDARVAAKELYGRQQVIAAKLDDYGEEADPSTCPTCERPGWDAGTAAHAELVAKNAKLLEALDVAKREGLKLRATFEASESALEQAREARGHVDQWDSALRALGARPEVPEADGEGPTPPSTPRPPAEIVAAVRENAAAAGARQQRVDDLHRAQALLESEAETLAALSAESDRLSALLDAVRTAPSTVAAEQALALGDLGPVSLRFGENPAVEVLIDGRPWWLASRGRQVVADGFLRAALRRVMEMDHLMMVLDNVQDVGGQPLPDVPPPLLLLQTDDGAGIRVKRR